MHGVTIELMDHIAPVRGPISRWPHSPRRSGHPELARVLALAVDFNLDVVKTESAHGDTLRGVATAGLTAQETEY